MLYSSSFTGEVYLRFLKRLIRSSKRKVFLIADCHPVHFRTTVQQWLEANSAQIEVFYLPSYSPQLNPVEYLNNDLKQQVHDKPPTRNLEELKYRVSSSLRRIQTLPERARNYFHHPDIAYAAMYDDAYFIAGLISEAIPRCGCSQCFGTKVNDLRTNGCHRCCTYGLAT